MAIQPVKMAPSKITGLALGALTGGVAGGMSGALAGAGKAALGGTPAGQLVGYKEALQRAMGPDAPPPADASSGGLNYKYSPDALSRRFSFFGGN